MASHSNSLIVRRHSPTFSRVHFPVFPASFGSFVSHNNHYHEYESSSHAPRITISGGFCACEPSILESGLHHFESPIFTANWDPAIITIHCDSSSDNFNGKTGTSGDCFLIRIECSETPCYVVKLAQILCRLKEMR